MPSAIFSPDALAGRVVLVTGGGTGLGRASSEELVACGATVVIAGRRQEVLATASEEIGCAYVQGDIREDADAARIVAEIVERFGRLDVLVNNAGGQYFAPAEAIEPKGWRAVMNLNVGGTLRMSEAAVDRAMRARGGGSIVNVTLSPHHGLTGMVHSSAARAAVGPDARARGALGGRRRRGRRGGGRSLRHAVAAQVPEGGLRRGGAHRPAPAAGPPRGVGLARHVAVLARRDVALRLDRDNRRRARQLVRRVAAALARGRDRQRPDRDAQARDDPLGPGLLLGGLDLRAELAVDLARGLEQAADLEAVDREQVRDALAPREARVG